MPSGHPDVARGTPGRARWPPLRRVRPRRCPARQCHGRTRNVEGPPGADVATRPRPANPSTQARMARRRRSCIRRTAHAGLCSCHEVARRRVSVLRSVAGELVADGVGCGLGAVVRADLAVDVGDMALDGARADRELAGDLLVALAGGQQAQDLDLAPGQAVRVTTGGYRSTGQA